MSKTTNNVTINYALFNEAENSEALEKYTKSISEKECFLVLDYEKEAFLQCKTLSTAYALFKCYMRKNTIVVRFDKMQTSFAKSYLKDYITKDNSEKISTRSKDIFIECAIKYEDFEKFFTATKEAVKTANTKQTATKSEAKQTSKATKKQTASKQTASKTA